MQAFASDNQEGFISAKPKRTMMKVIGAIMGIAVIAFLGLMMFAGQETPVQEAENLNYAGTYGCGALGKCWAGCNNGNGWCYTSGWGRCTTR